MDLGDTEQGVKTKSSVWQRAKPNQNKRYYGVIQTNEMAEPSGSLLPGHWRARMGQRTALFR